jgi:dipeptidyl-peptidase-4
MKINRWVAIGLLAMTTMTGLHGQAGAQQLKQFTLEDLNFGGKNYRKFVPQNRYLEWWGDELVRTDVEECMLIDRQSGSEKRLFGLDDLKAWSGLDLHSLYNVQFPEGGKPLVLLQQGGKRVLLNWNTHKSEWTSTNDQLANAAASAFCYASKATAYVVGHQLFVQRGDGQMRQLTTDGSRNIVYGQSVHRDEFGIDKGLFWSNDGQRLAFYRMDQTAVTDYPMVDIPDPSWTPSEGSRIATAAPEKYPMAGETSHKVTVGIYDLRSGKTVWLKAGDPTDRYFTNIAWSPDGNTIYMFELNRDQNDSRLVSYDAVTGERKAELYRETDDRYVEPLHPIVFLPWDDTKFILQSQRDGYNHLYLYNIKGKLLKQLTKGPWVVLNLLGFNNKSHGVVVETNELSPIQRNLFLVTVDNGKRRLIDDNGKGYHYGSVSASGQYVVDRYTTPEIPRNIAIASTNGKAPVRYFTAEDPWKGYGVPEYRCGSIKAADGTTDLYYRMVMPVGFDATKKYPTIVYVYGGPHAHNVDASWHYGSRSWETYMAQKGYLLFILDNRGSENRGKAFEQVTFRHLGDNEVKDQMQGVEYLKSLPYVDADRLGVHGWSFGGFMTINLMTTHPDVFKVGVAGGPVIDWKWYEVMYGERYMDTPQANPDGYATSSLLPKAKNLKGRLQVIIGLNDPVVVPQHAFSFLKQCIQDGTQPDFFVYPGEPHNMRGHQSTHLHERISRYFDDYLK